MRPYSVNMLAVFSASCCAAFKPAEDVAVRLDVPSLAAKEVAPQACHHAVNTLDEDQPHARGIH